MIEENILISSHNIIDSISRNKDAEFINDPLRLVILLSYQHLIKQIKNNNENTIKPACFIKKESKSSRIKY